MSKNSEISKDVDSENISDESTSDQAKSVENGVNGVRSDAENEEELVQQDESQVSSGNSTALNQENALSKTNESKEPENLPDAPEEAKTIAEANISSAETPIDNSVETVTRDEESKILPEQVAQKADKRAPESPASSGDQDEEIKTVEINTSENPPVDDIVESESAVDSTLKAEEIETISDSTVNPVTGESNILPEQVAQEVIKREASPESPASSGDQDEEIKTVEINTSENPPVDDPVESEFAVDSTLKAEEIETISDSTVNPVTGESNILPEQVAQEVIKREESPESPALSSDQDEEIKTAEINTSKNPPVDDTVESESAVDSTLKAEEIETISDSTVIPVAGESKILPEQVAQEAEKGEESPETPASSSDQDEEIKTVEGKSSVHASVDDPVISESAAVDRPEEIADGADVEKDIPVESEQNIVPEVKAQTKTVVKPWDDVDFTQLDKAGLVNLIELTAKEDDPVLAEKIAKNLKISYDVIHKSDREQALDKFVADGNDPNHFAFKFDELDNRFDGAFKLLRDKKYQFVKSLEKSKEKNLAEKVDLLEQLRALVDEEETTSSIQSVKKIQEQWRGLGPVPGQHVKTLWANYHALMDRYYDQRSIYFELKELDRRKNLEAKSELCEKAEKLVGVENLKVAISDLNVLHEEFKHIGPVPKMDQQALWDRFKSASDLVYSRRKEFIKHLKEDLKENFNKKAELAKQVQQYLQFSTDKISDWNKQTKEILNLQKQWEAIGGLPRESAKEVNKIFWGAFKGFFHNKGLFFKKLEGERQQNLEKKKGLVELAEKLKESTEWKETAEKLKHLQKEWKDIGPVPEKFRNSIYSQFKNACDAFFNKRRSQNQVMEKDYHENLQKKQQICSEIESMNKANDHDLDKFMDLKQQFDQIGYVPVSEVKNIRAQFKATANDYLAALPETLQHEAQQIKYNIDFEKLKKGPNADRRRDQKEQSLRREVSALENDISTWNNNLEFFANSKTAAKLKEEFAVKIDQAGDKLQELKSQLRALRQL